MYVCVCVWLVSRGGCFSAEWESGVESASRALPSPGVGGAWGCAAERGFHIKRHWVSCSLTKPFYGGLRSTVTSRQLKLCKAASRGSLSRGFMFTNRRFWLWPISCLWTLEALCWCWPASTAVSDCLDSKNIGCEAVFVSWSRDPSHPHTGEGKTDASQPLLPFTFSDLASPQEAPSTGISHASENNEVQPFLPYRLLGGSRDF